jgi:CspA family cold shock protein
VSNAKSKGTIKFFNSQKGFGFITPESGGKDLFVHISNVKGDASRLRDGSSVEYVEKTGPKGPEASDVSLV